MTFIDHTNPPETVDRVIVHQFDPARSSPGGIDTCLRGLCRYLPEQTLVAVIGVDTGSGPNSRVVGKWERHRLGEQVFWFLPVVALDPADQNRRVPHSIRLMWGIAKSRKLIPKRSVVQAHRMDSAVVLRFLLRQPQLYCIHTQENGLVGRSSDSFWRFLGGAHQALERSVVRNAAAVVVFNQEYAEVVRRWNVQTEFSPTWYDPELIVSEGPHGEDYSVLWVGRLETPKDPVLAVKTLAALTELEPERPWRLHLLGSGTLAGGLNETIAQYPAEIRDRIVVHGRVEPSTVAQMMSRADLFLMTSFPGYEGYPRVLVEAMASGLPAVVTAGSDTGGIVVDDATGYTCSRDPRELAVALQKARGIPRADVVSAVSKLDAPTLVGRMFSRPAVARVMKEPVE